MSTSHTLLHELTHLLSSSDSHGEASAIARVLLEEGLGWDVLRVFTGKDTDLSVEDRARLRDFVHRLQNGREPVQYVLGYAPFCHRRFRVRRGVLIPRPETELLVELVLSDGFPPREDAHRLLDVGTGSGCIAVSLALSLPDAQVEAWDISADALAVAEENARLLGAKVRFRRCDMQEEAERESRGKGEKEGLESAKDADDSVRYSALVSNPPYILPSERAEMDEKVCRWEPQEALFVPESDPLRPYRALCRIGRKRLICGGRIYMEINPLLASETEALLKQEGYGEVRILTDFAGKQRFIQGTSI